MRLSFPLSILASCGLLGQLGLLQRRSSQSLCRALLAGVPAARGFDLLSTIRCFHLCFKGLLFLSAAIYLSFIV